MKTQTYYNTPSEREADICNLSEELCVNCSGAVNEDYGIKTEYTRRDYYLMFMLEGNLKLELNSEKMQISSGDAVLISPGTKYKYFSENGEKVHYLWIHFSGRSAGRTAEKFKIAENTVYYVGIHRTIEEMWKRMFYEFVLKDEYFSEISVSILKEILGTISRYANTGEKRRNRFLKSLFFIHENYASDISISELAKMEGLSETHYRECFKKSMGISPKEYLTERRIEAACALLEQGDVSVFEAARLSGYSDAYYFGRIFKKKTGISPGKYKKRVPHKINKP